MKNLIFIFAFMGAANAETLMESCPMNWIAVDDSISKIVDSTCPAGYVDAGTVDSCITKQNGVCYLFAPTATDFTDDSGTYVFEEVCAYE